MGSAAAEAALECVVALKSVSLSVYCVFVMACFKRSEMPDSELLFFTSFACIIVSLLSTKAAASDRPNNEIGLSTTLRPVSYLAAGCLNVIASCAVAAAVDTLIDATFSTSSSS